MMAALICKEYGWTYKEYLQQPVTFINCILSMMDEESKAIKKRTS